jgi:dTDP-4-dehydrorhamnose reductase
MRVLILGGGGMLGHKLCQIYRTRFDAWATVRSTAETLVGYDLLDSERIREGVDAMRVSSVAQAIAQVEPDAVVNCIGIIKQRSEAQTPIPCLTVNSLFPHQLAEICRSHRARLIHISTDCVFSGRKGMYRESDASDAEDLYGRSKCLGEVGGRGCLTLRTSIVGRELSGANGLVEWFLGNRNGKVRGFRRAVFSGFTTRALAGIIADVLENYADLEGLYQVSSDPISKYDLLGLLNDVYRLGIQIEPDDQFHCDRSLDSSRFRNDVGFLHLGWREMIQDMHGDATPYDEWRAGTTLPADSAVAKGFTPCSAQKAQDSRRFVAASPETTRKGVSPHVHK